jgi:hypothetical protein
VAKFSTMSAAQIQKMVAEWKAAAEREMEADLERRFSTVTIAEGKAAVKGPSK